MRSLLLPILLISLASCATSLPEKPNDQEQASQLREELSQLDPGSDEAFNVRNNLSFHLRQQGKYDEALKVSQDNMRIAEASRSVSKSRLGFSEAGLAHAYKAVGQNEEAAIYYRRAIGNLETQLGKNHPYYTALQKDLASVS